MVKSCSFGQNSLVTECRDLRSGITTYRSPTMGICYTFNYGVNRQNVLGKEILNQFLSVSPVVLT